MKLLCRQSPYHLAPAPSCFCRVTPFLPQWLAARPDCPRQELNLIYDLRRVACCPSHSEDLLDFITPPRNRTSPDCFEGSHASSTLAGQFVPLKSRRLDSHQHKPVYKTGAFLSRATSAEAAIAAAQARGFEPHMSVLEADCSPRSTLV